MSSAEVTPEDAVRRYLQYLQDPSQLVDPDEIGRLEREAEATSDVVERLIVLSRLKRAREVDEDAFRRDFVTHARAFAAEHDIDTSAFLAMGVNPGVLAQAGFPIAGAVRGRIDRAGSTSGSGAPRRRAPKVGVGAIQDGVREWSEPFTLADVATKIGGSPATIRKAVDELVASGEVESLGPDRGHHGKGRAPFVYQRLGS